MGNAKQLGKFKAALIGIGLDSDGHKRLTTGPNFALFGGTQETHERMTEHALQINEKVRERGKQLEDISREEFVDIVREAGLTRRRRRAG
ncbi:MAG: hypothetical protein KGJ60_03515 [Verrucomicrobiota bacterium]|nr:hypothetical protein [Verrucomicrobiota bacterium]